MSETWSFRLSTQEPNPANSPESNQACCEECAKEQNSVSRPLALNLQPSRKNPNRYPPTPWSTQRLYRPFIRWALVVGILLGFATGAGMLLVRGFGVSPGMWWVTHAQSHGVAQVFGFAGLFTMGVAFHVIPRFRNGPMPFPLPQRVILTTMILGVVLRFGGQSIEDSPAVSGPLLVASGALMLGSILGFAVVAGMALLRGNANRSAAERWLGAGLVWLVMAGAIQLAVSVRMAADSTVIAWGPWNNALIDAGLLGFLGAFIFGVSTRTVTGFLGLKERNKRLEAVAFAVFNLGVGLRVAASLSSADSAVGAVGGLAIAFGATAFVVALHVLEPSSTPRKVMPGAYSRYSWFIRAAYAWMVVFAALTALESLETLAGNNVLPGADARPTIHVLTLGFITSMIIGMASRMIPLFEGSVIRGHRWLDAAWIALMLSVGLRITFGFVRPGADEWLAVSGILGLTAICVFAWFLLNSMSSKARESYRQAASEIGRVHWQAARG